MTESERIAALESALREAITAIGEITFVVMRLIPGELTPEGSALLPRLIQGTNAMIRATNLLESRNEEPAPAAGTTLQ